MEQKHRVDTVVWPTLQYTAGGMPEDCNIHDEFIGQWLNSKLHDGVPGVDCGLQYLPDRYGEAYVSQLDEVLLSRPPEWLHWNSTASTSAVSCAMNQVLLGQLQSRWCKPDAMGRQVRLSATRLQQSLCCWCRCQPVSIATFPEFRAITQAAQAMFGQRCFQDKMSAATKSNSDLPAAAACQMMYNFCDSRL